MDVDLIAAAGGWIVAIAVSYFSHREKTAENFLRGLEWLEGGTQRRSLGIAVLEEQWETRRWGRRRIQPATIPMLTNTAIYLLLESKQGDSAHERHNLKRVMHLLLDRGALKQGERRYYEELHASLGQAREQVEALAGKISERGLSVEVTEMVAWQERTKQLLGAQVTALES